MPTIFNRPGVSTAQEHTHSWIPKAQGKRLLGRSTSVSAKRALLEHLGELYSGTSGIAGLSLIPPSRGPWVQ